VIYSDGEEDLRLIADMIRSTEDILSLEEGDDMIETI